MSIKQSFTQWLGIEHKVPVMLENKAGIPIPSLMREAFDYPVLDYNTGEEIING